MTTTYDLDLVVRDVAVREIGVPVPAEAELFDAARHVVPGPRAPSALVGVSDGRSWGWWGPVPPATASRARALFEATTRSGAAPPGEWAARLRQANRHSHTGEGSVARGAFELACWDLLGHRHQVPVWRLLTDRVRCSAVAGYATCFGMRLDDARAPEVAETVRSRWAVQKWRPVRDLARPGSRARAAAAAAGTAGLALDFGGRWQPREAFALCAALPEPVAFAEEPVAPGEWLRAEGVRRTAPVAAGEHCYGADEAALLCAYRVDIWQPDAVHCGGLGDFMAIADLAARHGRPLMPHGGGLLPALHAAAAGSATAAVEWHLLLEPWRQAHLARPPRPGDDGTIPVPDLPGLGGQLRADLP